MKTETIRREALSLPVRERAELAEQLLSSRDVLSEAEIEQIWLRGGLRAVLMSWIRVWRSVFLPTMYAGRPKLCSSELLLQ